MVAYTWSAADTGEAERTQRAAQKTHAECQCDVRLWLLGNFAEMIRHRANQRKPVIFRQSADVVVRGDAIDDYRVVHKASQHVAPQVGVGIAKPCCSSRRPVERGDHQHREDLARVPPLVDGIACSARGAPAGAGAAADPSCSLASYN